jgi:hypothetical protein
VRRPALVVLGFVVLLVAACGGEKKMCRVNDQCFVCADDAAVAKCKADPTRSHCKWTPMSDCDAAKVR